VGEHHFGGFLKPKEGGEAVESDGLKKSHRELMEEIIAKSKKAKVCFTIIGSTFQGAS